MRTITKLAAVIVCCGSLFAADKKLQRSDFPLRVEVLSFAKQSHTAESSMVAPNCLNCTPVTFTWPVTEIRMNVTIDGKPYVIGCTTTMVGCKTMIIDTYYGRWGKHGLEILGADEHGKLQKTTYKALSGGQ